MKTLNVEFQLCDSEFFTALRLVAGSVCSIDDVDLDRLEDFKVCVTESALILKNCGFKSLSAQFCVGGGVSATLKGQGGTPKSGDNELSLALIGALVSKCDFVGENGMIETVSISL